MKSRSKFLLTGLATALSMGGILTAVLNQKAISGLHSDHQTFEENDREAERLEQENQEISRKLRENPGAETGSRNHEELLRLRNEATQLPRQVGDLKKLREENERLVAQAQKISTNQPGTATLQPDFVAKASIRDMGLATPENTVQTYFWAFTQGNIERMGQCMEAGNKAILDISESQRADMQAMAQEFQGFRIAEKRMISEDAVALAVAVVRVPGRGKPAIDVMPLKRVGNEWKISKF